MLCARVSLDFVSLCLRDKSVSQKRFYIKMFLVAVRTVASDSASLESRLTLSLGLVFRNLAVEGTSRFLRLQL